MNEGRGSKLGNVAGFQAHGDLHGRQMPPPEGEGDLHGDGPGHTKLGDTSRKRGGQGLIPYVKPQP